MNPSCQNRHRSTIKCRWLCCRKKLQQVKSKSTQQKLKLSKSNPLDQLENWQNR